MSFPDSKQAATTSHLYSPFWPLFAFFAALMYLQATYVVNDYIQLREMRGAHAQLQGSLTKSRVVSPMIEAVSGELLTLAAESKEAAKIVAEFKIQVHVPPGPAK